MSTGQTSTCQLSSGQSFEPAVVVREQFFLLDAVTCLPSQGRGLPAGLIMSDGHEPDRPPPGRDGSGGDGSGGVAPAPVQVDAVTPPCRDLSTLRDHLSRHRRDLVDHADLDGLVLAPLGAAPAGAVPVSSPWPADPRLGPHPGPLFNGMNIHVEIPGRDAAVSVMNRLRPWLHVVLALAANSPISQGVDTGFASWRTVQAGMWAVAGPPPRFADAADYDHHVERLLAMGVARGAGELKWSMRLSDQVPGVEIRAADVQLDVDAATMVTAVTSALVARALRDTTLGVVEPLPPHEVVRAACWHAARHGVGDLLVDLTPGTAGSPRAIPTDTVIEALLAYLEPAAGPDLEQVMPALEAALAGGSGAERQRRAWADGGLAGLLRLVRCCAPAPSAPPTR